MSTDHVSKLHTAADRMETAFGPSIPIAREIRDAADALANLRVAVAPFVRVAEGIPDNWRGETPLIHEEHAPGRWRINTLREGEGGGRIPTVDDYRRLLEALG